jgi:hypothetical protein
LGVETFKGRDLNHWKGHRRQITGFTYLNLRIWDLRLSVYAFDRKSKEFTPILTFCIKVDEKSEENGKGIFSPSLFGESMDVTRESNGERHGTRKERSTESMVKA